MNNEPKFAISIDSYSNKGLIFFLTLMIQDTQKYQFQVLLKLKCSLTVEPDLCVKDAYTEYLGIEVQQNDLLPEAELDFFQAFKHYRIDKYSPTAQKLTQEVDDYLNELLSERIRFKMIINELPESHH